MSTRNEKSKDVKSKLREALTWFKVMDREYIYPDRICLTAAVALQIGAVLYLIWG